MTSVVLVVVVAAAGAGGGDADGWQFVAMAGDDGGGTGTQPPLLLINSGTRANYSFLSPTFLHKGCNCLCLPPRLALIIHSTLKTDWLAAKAGLWLF